jgi:hypothetical protein
MAKSSRSSKATKKQSTVRNSRTTAAGPAEWTRQESAARIRPKGQRLEAMDDGTSGSGERGVSI